MTPLVAGWLAIGLPMLLFGLFFLSRLRPVLLMYLGACIIGLGYLTTTGAVSDVGAKLLSMASSGSTGTATKKSAPADVPARNPADGY